MDERPEFVVLLLEVLTARSRRPYRQATQLPVQLETRIVQLKKEYAN